jgi:hypothetical protein
MGWRRESAAARRQGEPDDAEQPDHDEDAYR